MWQDAGIPGRDVVENTRWGVAPSIAFGLGTPTRLTASYFRLQQDGIPDYGLPWVPATNVPLAQYANQAPPVDFSNFYGMRDRDYEKTTTDLGTVVASHDVGAGADAAQPGALRRHGPRLADHGAALRQQHEHRHPAHRLEVARSDRHHRRRTSST